MVVKKNTLLLATVLLLMTRCAFILPDHIFRSVISCENIASLICLIWFIYEVPRVKTIGKIMWFIALASLMAICSSIQASILYRGQSVFDGLMCQKIFISGILLVAIVYKLVRCGKMQLEEIEKILMFCAVFHMVVYATQFIIGPDRMFLSCYYTTPRIDSRVNRIRLYGGTQYIMFSYILALTNLGKKKRGNLLFIAGFIAYAIVVNQGRAFIVQAVALLLLALVLYKGSGTKKIFFVIAVIIIVSFVLSSDFFSSLINTFNTTTTGSHDTLAVRYRAQEYYLSVLRMHPLLGGGYADIQNSNAYVLSGYSNGFIVGDNGVYGLAFRYGLIGIVWLVSCMIAFAKNGIKLMQKKQDSFLLLELATILIGFLTSVAAFDGIGIFYTGLYIIFGITKLSVYRNENEG